MIFVANAENRWQFEGDLTEMHRQRKKVFVDGAGWKLPVVSGLEIDGYDHQDTMYLLAKDLADGSLLASVRLLTTSGPHLMSDLFAEACPNGVPRGLAIWEVSRFCTAPKIGHRSKRLSLLWEIICGIMETALVYGVEQVVFAANRALLPLALACGWEARILGPTLRDQNDEVTAVAAQVTPSGLRIVRERHRIPAPVIRLPAGVQARGVECYCSNAAINSCRCPGSEPEPITRALNGRLFEASAHRTGQAELADATRSDRVSNSPPQSRRI
jgi:acyl-homoserine lactone synthase